MYCIVFVYKKKPRCIARRKQFKNAKYAIICWEIVVCKANILVPFFLVCHKILAASLNTSQISHRWILLWARGTRDPYFTGTKEFVDQKTNLIPHGIIKTVNFNVQGWHQFECIPHLLSRSEEHTSELQSPDHLVCRLLLEKKNKQ